jgi:hypothetical protein
MKKNLVILLAAILIFTLAGKASAIPFDDFIDNWNGLGAALIIQGNTFSYSHNISDSVDLSKNKVTSAYLELDFAGALDLDRVYIPLVGWVDGREFVRYSLEGTSWMEIGEIDTSNNPPYGVDDVYRTIVDVGLINDDGILNVLLNVYNPGGTGTIFLDHSRLTGTAAPVPEPASMLLFGTGLVVFGFAGKKLKKK